ncbi:replication factor A protein, partial [Trifolium medium]|nr:replication factor A protein [Trifolium medium]
MFVDPSVAEVVNFRNGLVHYLSRGIDYTGLFRSSRRTPLTYNLDFMNNYPVRTMAELKNNPQLGVFVVNARICEIVSFDPWWFPICKCPRIFGNYIGAFHCVKCHVSKFIASPKVKLTFEVDDETGYGLFRAFDHVMCNVAALNCAFQGITADSFYQAFGEIMGKSRMFIVKKTSHEPEFIESAFELIRVSDHPSVIRYFTAKGVYKTPSKVVKKSLSNAGKQMNVVN